MGKGRDMAREMDIQSGGTGIHADVLEDFKDQLTIVLLKRLQKNGKVRIPVKEMDDTGQDIVSFAVRDGVFHFELSKKS